LLVLGTEPRRVSPSVENFVSLEKKKSVRAAETTATTTTKEEEE
jgi:hypothetical protein